MIQPHKLHVKRDNKRFKASRDSFARVAVVTDSIASLPSTICEREEVHVVPMSLILPEGVYRDGVDIDPHEYYRRLREDKLLPKTSAPSPGEYLALYDRLSKTHDSILVITPVKELTQAWNSARLAADMHADRLNIKIVDSLVAGPAQGFVAMAASRLALGGSDIDTILNAIESIQQNVGFVGVLDTLKFLVNGGRVTEARKWATLPLHIYPILYIKQGHIRLIGMSGTKARAIERMAHWLGVTLPRQTIAMALCHTDALEEVSELENRLKDSFQPIEHFVTELTPVIGAHTGPGLVGVAWWIQLVSSRG